MRARVSPPTVVDRRPSPAFVDRLRAAAVAALGWIEAGAARSAQRRALAELDDHRLRDIGVTRAEAAAEAAKPFWRGRPPRLADDAGRSDRARATIPHDTLRSTPDHAA